MDAMLKTYLVPFAYLVYALFLLVKPPEKDAPRGYRSQRAQRNEKSWRYAQRAAGLYCAACAAVLVLLIETLHPAATVQIAVELVMIVGMFPVVEALLKRNFPG